MRLNKRQFKRKKKRTIKEIKLYLLRLSKVAAASSAASAQMSVKEDDDDEVDDDDDVYT